MSNTELYGYVKSSTDGQFLSGIIVTAYHTNGSYHDTSTTDGNGKYVLNFPRNSGIWNLNFKDETGVHSSVTHKALIINADQQQQNIVTLTPEA